jgi:hypothetical protein
MKTVTEFDLLDETDLPEPTADDLCDEIAGLIGMLMDRDEIVSGSGIKAVITRAWKTGRVRPFVPASTLRVASNDDLWHDLEETVVQLRATGATRRRLNPVLRDLPKAPRTEAQQIAATAAGVTGRAHLAALRT